MPKVIIEFNLPEEQFEYDEATKARSYSRTIEDLDNYLRGKIKYDDTLTDEQYDVYQEIRSKLWELKNENAVS